MSHYVAVKSCKDAESKVHKDLLEYHIYYGGGVEWYKVVSNNLLDFKNKFIKAVSGQKLITKQVKVMDDPYQDIVRKLFMALDD